MSAAGPSRPAVALASLAVVGLLVLADLVTSAPIDPFAAPPPVAFGSGLAASGAHCASAPR